MERILVAPVAGKKIWLSELQGPLPKDGLYVAKNEEVKKYLADGLLEIKKQKKVRDK